MIRFDVLTIFPEILGALTNYGITSRAYQEGLYQLKAWNLREYAIDTRKTVDDRAYGGGPGMVMMVAPLEGALFAVHQEIQSQQIPKGPVVLLSPQGRVFSQKIAQELSELPQLTLVCGRYEAVDQRFIEHHVDFELSLGDFVVSGGEIPAMAVMDAVIRMLPGALGDESSAKQDSFMNGLLDCPHYTRPEKYQNSFVPDVLLGGNHAKIADWRREKALIATQIHRPDLIESARRKGWLSTQDERVLKSFLTQTD